MPDDNRASGWRKFCKSFHRGTANRLYRDRKCCDVNACPRLTTAFELQILATISRNSRTPFSFQVEAVGSILEESPRHTFMSYKEFFWMACDSTDQLRAEYGPFHTRQEAESEAQKLGFGYLLRYEHILGENDEIDEVRCIFIELPGALPIGVESLPVTLHTRCASCGESAVHDKGWQAEVWADIHEFEHSRHRVRLFQHARGKGLKEIGDWRG